MLRNKVETKSIFLNLLHIKKGWTSKTICVNSADTNENHYYLEQFQFAYFIKRYILKLTQREMLE